MKKYIAAPVLAFMIFLMSAVPCSASESLTYENFEYHSNESGITIDSYFGGEETVDIPAYIGNEQVTEIADYAFLLSNTVVTVNVPESITTVGEKAFTGASKLKNINTVPISKVENDETESGTSNESGQETTETEQDGIEQAVDDENNGNSDTDSNQKVNSDNKGIIIPQTDSYVTIDDKNHLIIVDKEGNSVVLDDTQEYKIVDNGKDDIKIVNKNGKEITIDQDGNVIVPEKDRFLKSKNVVIVIIVIALVPVIGGGIFYFVRKRQR